MSKGVFKKATLMDLEEKLFTGTASHIEMMELFEEYGLRNNQSQRGRIAEIIYRKLNKVVRKNTIYIKSGEAQTATSENVQVFIFDEAHFFNGSHPEGCAKLAQMILLPETKEVLLKKEISEKHPKAVALIELLCLENNVEFRKQGKQSILVSRQLSQGGNTPENLKKYFDAPTEIAIIPMVAPCNIKCRFCEQAFRQIPSAKMDFDVFKAAIQAVPNNTFIELSLTPYSEPLSKPKEYFTYLEHALKERPYANVNFNTNGVCLTEEISRYLVDIGLKTLNISLNMPDVTSYKAFSGHDFFDLISKNIKNLHKVKQEKQSKFPIVNIQFLNAPPVLGNEQKLKSYWEQWSNSVWFRNISPPTQDEKKLKIFKEENPEIIIPTRTAERLVGQPCVSLYVTCGIDMKGNYLPCCLLAIESAINPGCSHKKMEIGNVYDMDILTAWRSPKWQQLRAWQIAELLPCCIKCTNNQASSHRLAGLRETIMQHCYGV